jgi:hypothetical protein
MVVTLRTFGCVDFDSFVQHVWCSTSMGAECLAFEARLAAQRLDGRYAVSQRLAEAARAARVRAVETDAKLSIGQRWQSFSMDFSCNWLRVPIHYTSSPFPEIYSTLRLLISKFGFGSIVSKGVEQLLGDSHRKSFFCEITLSLNTIGFVS